VHGRVKCHKPTKRNTGRILLLDRIRCVAVLTFISLDSFISPYISIEHYTCSMELSGIKCSVVIMEFDAILVYCTVRTVHYSTV